MRITIVLIAACLFTLNINAQVTIGEQTLPEPLDVLEYETFMDYQGNQTYRDQGEDLSWSFDGIELTGSVQESYAQPDSALQADFPEAEFSYDLVAFATAGIRTDSTLEIVGVGGADFIGFEFNAQTFPDPFVLRSVPMSLGSSIEDRINLPFVIDAGIIPGLDSLELPIPGATLDSIRITSRIYKKETATAWGTLDFMGVEQEVLKVEQIDSTDFAIDIGLGVFGQIIWLDASLFLGALGGDPGDMGGIGGGPQGTLTYKFLSPESKLSILEFTELTGQDTSGMDFTTVNGRVGVGLLNTISEPGRESDYSLYPNPVINKLYLQSEGQVEVQAVSAFIVDFQGNLLRKWQFPRIDEGFELQGLSAGPYVLLVETVDKVLSLPFVKTE